MKLKKHNTTFATKMDLLDVTADNQLARELMELHENKCRECQEDRLSCTVRPSCKDRNFLNMLIELGIEPEDLPSFCYSQYLNHIRRFITDRKGSRMIDRRLPIKDFLSALRVSSIRHFTTKFKKTWSKSASIHRKDAMLVAGDGLLFYFDFARGIVVMNPVHVKIKSLEEFKLYADLFSKYYDLKSEVKDVTLNWWILNIAVDVESTVESIKPVKSKLSGSFDALTVESSENVVNIHAEVIIDENRKPLSVDDLEKAFTVSSKLRSGEISN
jgi:hypothetical protein